MSKEDPDTTTDWDNLTAQAAFEDSPFFRVSLQHVEDEVEEAGQWIENFVKNIRGALEVSHSTRSMIAGKLLILWVS